MAWDPKGERLAVIFDMMSSDEGGDNELVAIYEAKVHPSFAMTLVGWVRGPAGCGRPIDVAFKPHFEEGALLSTYPCQMNLHSNCRNEFHDASFAFLLPEKGSHS